MSMKEVLEILNHPQGTLKEDDAKINELLKKLVESKNGSTKPT